jgi:hypothetical protein
MSHFQRLSVLLLTISCSVAAYAHHLAVVVPKDNHSDGVTSAELEKIMKSEMKKWPNGTNVVVVITKSSAMSVQVLGRLCNMSAAATKALIAAHPDYFIMADSDEALLKIVEVTPGALGLVDVHAIQGTQIHVLKVDGKLPMEKNYLPH